VVALRERLDAWDERIIHGGARDRRPRWSGRWAWLWAALDWLDTTVLFRGRDVRGSRGRYRSIAEMHIAEALHRLGERAVYEGGPDRHGWRGALVVLERGLVVTVAGLAALGGLLWLADVPGDARGRTLTYLGATAGSVVALLAVREAMVRCLRLGDDVVHPDFWLPDRGVFIEYWGLADTNRRYARKMKARRQRYREHGVTVIDLYPRHDRDFEAAIRAQLEKLDAPDPDADAENEEDVPMA
jgi:hypothetical protein